MIHSKTILVQKNIKKILTFLKEKSDYTYWIKKIKLKILGKKYIQLLYERKKNNLVKEVRMMSKSLTMANVVFMTHLKTMNISTVSQQIMML